MKEFVFYYVLLIFVANIHGLFPCKTKRVLQLPMFSKILITNQNKYEWEKVVNFTIDQ